MARIARIVVPECPHHVTQRGNRRQPTFFCDRDYRDYLELLAESCRKAGTAVWAYCLMPNHVHLVMVPDKEDGLRAAPFRPGNQLSPADRHLDGPTLVGPQRPRAALCVAQRPR